MASTSSMTMKGDLQLACAAHLHDAQWLSLAMTWASQHGSCAAAGASI
jgi:hypothetical protein